MGLYMGEELFSLKSGIPTGGTPTIEELNVTQNGTYTAEGAVDGYSPVVVDVTGAPPAAIAAGNTPVAMTSSVNRRAGTTYAAISGVSLTIQKSGTYRFRWLMFRSSTSGTFGTRLYKNGVEQGTNITTFSNHSGVCSVDVACNAGDVVSVYGRSGSTTTYIYAGFLTACIDWDNSF